MKHVSPSSDTRENILDIAEELFALHGFDATSIRDITQKAGANLGAINYHFGSKDGLIELVFKRRLIPLNEARLALLDHVEANAKAKGETPSLEQVLHAFIEPMVDLQANCGDAATSFSRLLCRSLQETNPEREQMIHFHFKVLIDRIYLTFQRILPQLPEDEIFWNMTMMFGACHQTLDSWSRFYKNTFARPEGVSPARELSRAELIERLVKFSVAGIRAAAAIERSRD